MKIDDVSPLCIEHPRSEQARVARREYRRWRRRNKAMDREAIRVRAADRHRRSDDDGGVVCPTCHADAGNPCVSRSGRVRSRVHRKRENLSRATAPSCEGCGACCLARVWGDGAEARSLEPFVAVFDSEARFYRPDELVEDREGRVAGLALRVENGRCFALVGAVPGARCGIYANRPATCSGFVAGSYRCRVARARAGVGPAVRGAF